MERHLVKSPVRLSGAGAGLTLSIEELPLWQGVRRQPGPPVRLPFRLGLAEPGPIRQTTEAEVVERVLASYAGDEYSFLTKPPGSSAWANSLGDTKAAHVLGNWSGPPPRAVLEVGAGSTYVAEKLRPAFGGAAYTIVDPALREAEAPVELVRDYFPCAALEGRRFDLIIGFNCLEHVPDPVGFLRVAGRALAPGGRVLMTYPDAEINMVEGDINALMHEHLNYFTESSSLWAFQAAGLVPERLDRHEGALIAVLTRRPDLPPPAGELREETLLRHAAETLDALFRTCGADVARRLDQGESVAFHGATNGLNSFLSLTGLGAHPRIRIYDGDDTKVGMFLPTCPHPIASSADPAYASHHVVYVSAVTFLRPILRFAAEVHGLPADRLKPLAV